MDVTVNIRGIERTVGNLRFWQEKKKTALRALIAEYALRIEKDVKESLSGPGSGRRYGNHVASAPGEPPATDTGRLRASIRSDLTDLADYVARVGTNLKYARFLELGTSKMLARPFLQPAFDRHARDFYRDLIRVLS